MAIRVYMRCVIYLFKFYKLIRYFVGLVELIVFPKVPLKLHNKL